MLSFSSPPIRTCRYRLCEHTHKHAHTHRHLHTVRTAEIIPEEPHRYLAQIRGVRVYFLAFSCFVPFFCMSLKLVACPSVCWGHRQGRGMMLISMRHKSQIDWRWVRHYGLLKKIPSTAKGKMSLLQITINVIVLVIVHYERDLPIKMRPWNRHT